MYAKCKILELPLCCYLNRTLKKTSCCTRDPLRSEENYKLTRYYRVGYLAI